MLSKEQPAAAASSSSRLADIGTSIGHWQVTPPAMSASSGSAAHLRLLNAARRVKVVALLLDRLCLG